MRWRLSGGDPAASLLSPTDGAFRSEVGSVTIVVAGTLFLAGVLALVTLDLLRTLQAQASAQSAADAAALAAAQELAIPSGTWSPTEAARFYAELNGGTLLDCRCDPGGSEALVQVQIAVRLVFVGHDRQVVARARAVVGSAAAAARVPVLATRPQPRSKLLDGTG
jgi:secretion/DNA translocation related TadE-like protein